MNAKGRIETGTPLEARVQRLFLCQGVFAERGLMMRASPADHKMVTDIDVVAHDYSLNFHHRRTYAECKGGKSRSALDRVIWVRGIKEVIAADHAYLVIDHCDASTVRFARSQGIEILQGAGLAALEGALRISDAFWPGRSNHVAFAPMDAMLRKMPPRPPAESTWAWLRQALDLSTESSALTYSYGRLNALLGVLQECKALALADDTPKNVSEETLLVSFAAATLLVRLSQYILFIAADTLSMSHSARLDYLSERLVSGGLEIGQSRQLLYGALQMVNAQLSMAGVEAAKWNIESMLAPPNYTEPLATVVERVIGDCYRSAMLPLGMELRLFGYGGDESAGGSLLSRARFAHDVTGLVLGFARQSLGVPEALTRGMTGLIGVNPMNPNTRVTRAPTTDTQDGPGGKQQSENVADPGKQSAS